MKETIEKLYKIEIKSLIKISPKVYKVITNDKYYILKMCLDNAEESTYARIAVLNLNFLLLPHKSINERYIESFQDQYFTLSDFLKDENTLAKDIRLNFYVKMIASLHQQTTYNIRVGDGFFDESLKYLDNSIKAIKDTLNSRIERVERQDYHSPGDWFFLMNYQHLFNALNEADRLLDLLDEQFKSSPSLHLSLTYQNFDYSHILLKQKKIISLDKMVIAPSIYDLVQLFEATFQSSVDFKYLLKNYLSVHQLEDYEITWFKAILFIPKIERKNDDIEDIAVLNQALSRLKEVEELSSTILKNSSAESQKQ